MNRIGKLLTVVLVALAALPAVGVAATPRYVPVWPRHSGFEHTYPNASGLCARIASGRTPARLAGQGAQVSAACTQLQAGFAAARTTYLKATTPLRLEALTTIQQYVQICRQDRLNHDAKACGSAREAAVTTLDALRVQVRTAARAYRTAVKAAREAFWTSVHALPGGTAVKADSTPAPSPPSPIPADASVPGPLSPDTAP